MEKEVDIHTKKLSKKIDLYKHQTVHSLQRIQEDIERFRADVEADRLYASTGRNIQKAVDDMAQIYCVLVTMVEIRDSMAD